MQKSPSELKVRSPPLPEVEFVVTVDLSPKAAEIISHTRSLLEVGGYKSFSYADISARVNIRKASIHHHFPSKAELVRVLVSLYRQEAQQGLAMIDQNLPDPLAKLNAYFDYWSNCIEEGQSSFCICAMLAFEIPTLPAEVADEVQQHFHGLTTWLTTQLEQGQTMKLLRLRDTPSIEAKALMASVHGAMLTARALGDQDAFRALMQISIKKLTC